MEDVFTTDIINTLEDADFKILTIGERQKFDYFAELEWYSPEGEDFIVSFFYDGTDRGLVDGFVNYAINFDADDHAEGYMNMRGKNGVPSSARALIIDADAIKRQLLETAEKLNALYLNGR